MKRDEATDLYPQIFIEDVIPQGWANEYPTVEIRSAGDARSFLEKYGSIEASFVIGIDLRGASYYLLTLFLKFLEDTTLKVIIRATELVPGTIISRMSKVEKKAVITKKSPWAVLVGGSKIAGKIIDLK